MAIADICPCVWNRQNGRGGGKQISACYGVSLLALRDFCHAGVAIGGEASPEWGGRSAARCLAASGIGCENPHLPATPSSNCQSPAAVSTAPIAGARVMDAHRQHKIGGMTVTRPASPATEVADKYLEPTVMNTHPSRC